MEKCLGNFPFKALEVYLTRLCRRKWILGERIPLFIKTKQKETIPIQESAHLGCVSQGLVAGVLACTALTHISLCMGLPLEHPYLFLGR